MRHSRCHVPQMILHNAHVHIVDRENTIEQAIALAGNKVLAVGSDAEILALADVVLLDRSLVGIDPEDIRNVQVCMTIVDGRVAFER